MWCNQFGQNNSVPTGEPCGHPDVKRAYANENPREMLRSTPVEGEYKFMIYSLRVREKNPGSGRSCLEMMHFCGRECRKYKTFVFTSCDWLSYTIFL